MDVKVAIHSLTAPSAYQERTGDGDSDEELVVAAQRDATEFVFLYDRYFSRVHGYVSMHVNDEATAEDVTSQIFTTALAQINAFQARGTFSAWLFRIARNAVHDVYRRKVSTTSKDDAVHNVPDSDPGPEEQALAAERAADLHVLLSTLRPDHQELLALRYGAELSFSEIAQTVGKSSIAVRVSVSRILADLRRRYFSER
jgi:RNA polymerase sigma-70 factor, ECF subfamily